MHKPQRYRPSRSAGIWEPVDGAAGGTRSPGHLTCLTPLLAQPEGPFSAVAPLCHGENASDVKLHNPRSHGYADSRLE
ncbi:hypothetical protein HPB47_000493 [Ixodes persulcatus]|uniref:Uncharacterized protein n=1 Tax=Ixodes persulcatus TaxID=34615 RepID=A0AC60PRH9_IXOPE|nr:hypothetical protein HPB47_000493 [Ixodes persulcatus]